MHLAARPGVLTAAELADAVDGEVGRYSPYAVYLGGGDPGRLAALRDGQALVQDEGSQLVARALTLAPLIGDDTGRWLDLCAGPGGKTALLAAIAAEQGAAVTAVELNPRRAELVEHNTRGLPVEVLRADGRETAPGGGNSTASSSTRRAPVWGRCAGARRRAGGALPPMSPPWRSCNANCLPRRSGSPAPAEWCCSRPAHRIWPRPSAWSPMRCGASRSPRWTPGSCSRPAENLGAGPYVQLWPHRHGTDAMFAAALRKDT